MPRRGDRLVVSTSTPALPLRRSPDRLWLHALLVLATLVTTTFAGATWAQRDLLYARDAWFIVLGWPVGPSFLADGLRFSVPLMAFLLAHEMGHYVAARRHRLNVSLPYVIPLPLPPPLITFGTLGAVIRIREPLPTTRILFDVGAAGPLAGLAVALPVLIYALLTLPGPDYLMSMSGQEAVQAAIQATGTFPASPPGIETLGTPLTLVPPPLAALALALVPDAPPAWELYHYPTLLAAWLSLLFTALNLLPVGQLDGGHVVYALFGPRVHRIVARVAVVAMLVSGTTAAAKLVLLLETTWERALGAAVLVALVGALLRGTLGRGRALWIGAAAVALGVAAWTLLWPAGVGFAWLGWLVWATMLVRVVKVDHPPVLVPNALTAGQRVAAWLCIAAFVACIVPVPIYGGG